MKSVVGVILVLGLLAGLMACARQAEGVASAAGARPVPGEAGAGGLPDILQLAAGTLELDESDLAVDAGQAAELLPLWKAYRALSASDTVVQLELEALVVQIRETMSPEQTRAIAEMQLTFEDVTALTQELGISTTGTGGAGRTGGTGATLGRQGGADFGGGGPGGAFLRGAPGGAAGVPAGVPMMAPGGQVSGAASGVAQAAGARAAASSPLIDAVIDLLEAKG